MAVGPPVILPIAEPMTGGEGHHWPSGRPLKTLKRLPYCGSRMHWPCTSAPALKEMPVGGALSPTAKSFPSEVLPTHTSQPAKQVTRKSPRFNSFFLKPVFSQVSAGKMDCVV